MSWDRKNSPRCTLIIINYRSCKRGRIRYYLSDVAKHVVYMHHLPVSRRLTSPPRANSTTRLSTAYCFLTVFVMYDIVDAESMYVLKIRVRYCKLYTARRACSNCSSVLTYLPNCRERNNCAGCSTHSN